MENIFKAMEKAMKKNYAIGAFNFYNLETLQAIMEAGEELKVPVICSASESALKYMGLDTAVMMFQVLIEDKKYPAFLHLDHGKSFEICKKAVDAGFDSVMIDASNESFDKNVKITQKVVNYAHKFGVFVEAEIGSLSGIEDDIAVDEKDSKFTNPEQAKYFVELTGVDSLAVAIGTSHGAYKFNGNPKLRLDILTEIENKVKIPLVLHGASTVSAKVVKDINNYGGDLQNAKGVSIKDLKDICKNHHVCKVNSDTDLRLAFISAVREDLFTNPKQTNPREFLSLAKEYMKNTVICKYKEFLITK